VAQLPPVLELLLAEDFDGIHTPAGFRRALKRLEPELRRQAEWSVANHTYSDLVQNSTDFVVRPSGALDVFTPLEICQHIRCRFKTAEQFARSVCLFADRVVLPDVFTARFTMDEWDSLTAEAFTRDIVVLGRIAPLIRAGVISFCGTNDTDEESEAIASRIDHVTDKVLDEVASELKIARQGTSIRVASGRLLDPELQWYFPISRGDSAQTKAAIGLAGFRTLLRRDVESILYAMRSAQLTNAVLASGSRLGVLAIKSAEHRSLAVDNIEDWEAIRSIHLPWVDDLSASEVVRLREDAATALPRLRALMTSKLAVPTDDTEKQALDVVHELRTEAAEVEAELRALKWPRERGFRTLTGSLGITVAIYGLAAGFVAPAVGIGSLLSLLGILHAAERSDERQHNQLSSRPGYLLIRARELLAQHDHTLHKPGLVRR